MDWSSVVGIVYLLNTIFAVVVIFFERRNSTATLAWLTVLFSLPMIGFVLYPFLGQNYTRQRLFTLKEKDDAILKSIFEEQHRGLLDKFTGLNFSVRPTAMNYPRFGSSGRYEIRPASGRRRWHIPPVGHSVDGDRIPRQKRDQVRPGTA